MRGTIRQISLYLILALAGYAAGRRFAKPPESEPAAPPIHSEGSASSGSIPRSAPSRATFEEKQPRLRELAEVHFREARELGVDESLSDAGFFWGESFALPENYALTEEGLYFYYNPYEIAAYVVGPTSFTISREQMAGLLAEGY